MGIELRAALKLAKQTLLISNFLALTINFWIMPAIRRLVNSNFRCSKMLSFTGTKILVRKFGKTSYKKCSGKGKIKAIIKPINFNAH